MSDGCLPGITREVLLDEIEVPGLNVSERELRLNDLYEATEVFVTSSTRGLLPVAEIAGRALKPSGDAGERLSAAYRNFVKEDIARRKLSMVGPR